MTQPTHGGKREGAGRPPTDDRKRQWNTKFSPDVLAFLRTLPNQAAFVESLIKKTGNFQHWIQNKQD